MKTILITYDLVGTDDSSDNYKKLTAAIAAYGTYARAQLSVWFVVTEQSPEQVYNNLTKYMHPSDRLFVIRTHRSAIWRNVKYKDEWFQQFLYD